MSRNPNGVTLKTSADDLQSTPNRILSEASKLFALHGFHGTSTRDIALAVGIRQPSLFHHFATKHAILAALLDLDLDVLDRRIRLIDRSHESSAVKLHCHLVLDIVHILEFPFDVRGLYVKNEEVPDGPEFSAQRRKLAGVHKRIKAMVEYAVTKGEFVDIDPELVRQLVSAAFIGVMWTRGPLPARRADKRADELPNFIVRGLLADPSSLGEVIEHSRQLQAVVTAELSPTRTPTSDSR